MKQFENIFAWAEAESQCKSKAFLGDCLKWGGKIAFDALVCYMIGKISSAAKFSVETKKGYMNKQDKMGTTGDQGKSRRPGKEAVT